jgi:ribosomal protein S6--L-glutamate ligase
MMRIGILCSEKNWYFRDLRRAAGADHDVVPLAFERLTASLGPPAPAFPAAEHELLSFDAVLVRTMPAGTLEQVVFRMDVLARLEAAGQVVLNPPKAIEAAVDKYLALAKLQRAGLAVPHTISCQTVEDAMAAFDRLGGDVVVKPLFGSEGRGMTRITDEALALRAFQLLCQVGSVVYLQKFVPHDGSDVRALVIGDKVYGMRRRHPSDWRTNVARGATCEPCQLSNCRRETALAAARAVGAPLAGVDLLCDRDGAEYVVEVNAVPGWKALGTTLGVDISTQVIDYVKRIAAQRARGSIAGQARSAEP